MTTMTTHSGVVFDLADPKAADVLIGDIAHHLSLINRFNGATCRPYSVAEHSILVMDVMLVDLGVEDTDALFAGLMHDAHEAYFGDITSPIKSLLGARGALTELKIGAAVHARFDIRPDFDNLVKRADMIALATEKRDLLPTSDGRWMCLDGIDPSPSFDLMSGYRRLSYWKDWKENFLRCYRNFNSA